MNPEPSLTSIINHEVLAHLAHLKVKQDINSILAQLKNGKTCRRVLQQILPGTTVNDAEFTPTILWCMFGTSGPEAKPKHPLFPYPDNRREMSLYDLEEVLKRTYRVSPSYGQLKRIFKGLKLAKLVTNILTPRTDKSGQCKSTSYYEFNIENWKDILVTTNKTPEFKTGKKRGPKRSTLDSAVTERHRVKVKRCQKNDDKTLDASGSPGAGGKPDFSASPWAEVKPVIPIGNREGGSAPGVSELSAGSTQLVASPAGQKKKQASPAVEICDFISQKEASSRLKARMNEEGPSYAPLPSNPGWQVHLEAVIEHKALNGENPDDWQKSLYTPEEGADALTLKPRIPDCTVLVPDEQSDTCGVWSHAGPFIRLNPADLETADLLERGTACPLRAQDWQHLVRLTHRKASDPNRLNKARLAALLRAFPDIGSAITEMIDGVQYDHGTLLPEVFGADRQQHELALTEFHDLVRVRRLDLYLPYLHCDEASAKALLSPGNAGKLLFHWDELWTALCKCIDTQGWVDRSQLAGIKNEPAEMPGLTLAELDRGVSNATSAIPYLNHPIDLSHELTPLAYIQHAPQGVRSLLPETRKKLHYVMLTLYTSAPHIWCDLERWMGTESFAAAMPVLTVDACRASARKRVSEMVRARWQEPYTSQATASL